MKNRKFFLSLVIMLFITFGLSASGNTETESQTNSDENEQVEITYWYPWGGDSEKWDMWRIEEFEKKYPNIKVNAIYVPDDGGLKNGKLLAAIAGGKAPDVVISNSYPLSYAFASKGTLEPLDDALARAGFDEDQLLPAFYDIMKFDGKTYIFPHDSNVNMLYYNVDLFREAGLDPDNPPSTIEELDAAAEKLTKISSKGNIERMGFVPWLDAAQENAYLWGWMFGTTFYNVEENKLQLNSQPLVNTLNWLKDYGEKYDPERIQAFSKGFGGAFSPDHPFFNGKVAMTVNGNWFTNAIKLYAPDVNYRVAPIPAPSDGRKNASVMGTNVFLVPKGTKNIDAVIKFILFASKPEISASNINTWRSLSAWKGADPSIIWYENEDPIYKMELEIANNPNSGHPGLISISSEISDELLLVIDKVIYEHLDPKPLLDAMQEKFQKELDNQ